MRSPLVMEFEVRFPDVSPDDVALLRELFDATPEYDTETRQRILDFADRVGRMILTAVVRGRL